MEKANYQRLLELADQLFNTKSDPEQLDVNEAVINTLHQISPVLVYEHQIDQEAVAWVTLIPSNEALTEAFINGGLTEKTYFEKSVELKQFDTIYLCSAIVLEEFRHQGIVSQQCKKAIELMRQNHPIKQLAAWPFTTEGLECANSIARQVGLPLILKSTVNLK
jgi:hypothetical protein